MKTPSLPSPRPHAAAQTFAHRGLHLDLRVQPMPLHAVKGLLTEMARDGLNTLILEYEATYPFANLPAVASPWAFTPDEIGALVAHGTACGIEIIPLQQCFGHVEYILHHPRHAALRENARDPSQICPLKIDGARELFAGIFGDLAKRHPGRYLHLGGDETYLLGQCPECAAVAAVHGKSRLFVDYMSVMTRLALDLGRIPIVWSDIALKHPEDLPRLPSETVFMDWNYGWAHDRFGDPALLKACGHEVWGAPALRSSPDHYGLTQWGKHLENLTDFIPWSRRQGYRGMILTSWSTSGIYGYQWGDERDIEALDPMRRVYPLSGFSLLRRAFREALATDDPLSGRTFLTRQGTEHFGLTKVGAEDFADTLLTPVKTLAMGKPEDLAPIAEQQQIWKKAQKTLARLKPSQNRKEWEHLRLITDMRVSFIEGRRIAQIWESGPVTAGERNRLGNQVKALLKKLTAESSRFRKLQKGFLYPGAIDEEIAARERPMRKLAARILGIR